jgi:hypothetical protein
MTEFLLKNEILREMSCMELLNYRNKLVMELFKIDVPLNEEEITRFELLSAQCDVLDSLI